MRKLIALVTGVALGAGLAVVVSARQRRQSPAVADPATSAATSAEPPSPLTGESNAGADAQTAGATRWQFGERQTGAPGEPMREGGDDA